MSYFEEYQVSRAKIIGNPANRIKLNLNDPSPAEFTPISALLLVKGASPGQSRTGQEEGNGSATIYLDDSDFALAQQFIQVNTYVNYQSQPIQNTNKSDIWNFNFPEA